MMSTVISTHCLSIVSLARRSGDRSRKMKSKPSPSKNTTGAFSAAAMEVPWRCVEGCGACCKLDKGPAFATPEEIFTDPRDIELYTSLIGEDGWCINYDKKTRTCSIYSDRPYFCHVLPDVFEKLYGISPKKFSKEACSSCRDTIKAVYGSRSQELNSFNRSVMKTTLLDHPTPSDK